MATRTGMVGIRRNVSALWNNNDFVDLETELDKIVIQNDMDKYTVANIINLFQSHEDEKFTLEHILKEYRKCMQGVIEDDFTQCFTRKYIPTWNWNFYLCIFWSIGFVFRYLILVPLRILMVILLNMAFFSLMWLWEKLYAKDSKALKNYQLWTIQLYAQGLVAIMTSVVCYHGSIPRKKANQIFVCNHTTMLDVALPMQMASFSLVGQAHSKPSVVFLQQRILKALNCIWFNRKEKSDRELASQRISQHIANVDNPRLLIFPEGTCVNNEVTVMFKRGVFGLKDVEICPVAIKYDKKFCDTYWISRERSFFMHVLDVLSSWFVVCDVYWLDPQKKRPDESAEDFALRVQKMVSEACGLKVTKWNGYMKHYMPSQRVKDAPREMFAKMLTRKLRARERRITRENSLKSLQSLSFEEG